MKTLHSFLHLLLLATIANPVIIKITKIDCDMNKNWCQDISCYLTNVRQRITLLNYGCTFVQQIDHFLITFSLERLVKTYQKFFEYNADGCDIIQGSVGSPVISRLLERAKKYISSPTKCPFVGNMSITNCPLDFSIFPSIIPRGQYRANINSFGVGKYRNESFVRVTVFLTV